MIFGYPFESFDHQNYINFLNSPYPFFFEPLYTLLAYLVAYLFSEDYRFLIIFILFGSLPSFLMIKYADNDKNYLYLWILVKSALVGFISQRFWFSELWFAYFYLTYKANFIKLIVEIIGAGMIHFGIIGNLPIVFFANKKINKYIYLIFILGIGFLCYFILNDFKIFNYDYSRYLEVANNKTLSLYDLGAVAYFLILNIYITDKKLYKIIFYSLVYVLVLKILFNNLEVYSRVYQANIDLMLILIFSNLSKRIYRLFLPLYVTVFYIGVLFFKETGPEILFHNKNAFNNLVGNIF